MSDHTETLKEFDDFIAGAVEDFADEDMDPSDYCWQVADGSSYSIYYAHAWDLVQAIRAQRTSDLVGAEMDYADVFQTDGDTSIDTHMCRLAYLLTHAALWEAVTESIAA